MQNSFVLDSVSKPMGSKSMKYEALCFFGSISTFNQKFDVKSDPEIIEVDFVESRIGDHSAIEAIFNLVNKYHKASKTIKLKHLSQNCKILLYKSRLIFIDVIVEAIDDPHYHLAENPEVFERGLSEYSL